MNEFWYYACLRAGRTMAQTALSVMGVSSAEDIVTMSVIDINWQLVVSASIVAGIISLLMSIATGLPEVAPAIEAEDDDIDDTPAVEYNVDGYDDLKIDDEVDEGEDDEVEEEN